MYPSLQVSKIKHCVQVSRRLTHLYVMLADSVQMIFIFQHMYLTEHLHSISSLAAASCLFTLVLRGLPEPPEVLTLPEQNPSPLLDFMAAHSVR